MKNFLHTIPNFNPNFSLHDISLPDSREYPTITQLKASDDPYLVARVHEMEIIKCIAGATHLVADLIRHGRQQEAKPSELRDLAFYIANLQAVDIDTLVMGHRVNPYLDLLLEARDLIPGGIPMSAIPLGRDALPPDLTSLMRQITERMRERAADPAWQTRLENILRRCRDNHLSLRLYLDAQFLCHSRHLVIRLDLGYTKDHPDVMSRPGTISEDQAKADFDRFIRLVRSKYAMTGFARRLEYGLYSGVHFHALILLDGHKHRCDLPISREMCELWRGPVTEGQGRYYNCNLARYHFPATGLVGHRDTSRRYNLLEHLGRYITKAEFWVEGQGGGRGFVRGQMPLLNAMGRPRLAELDSLFALPG